MSVVNVVGVRPVALPSRPSSVSKYFTSSSTVAFKGCIAIMLSFTDYEPGIGSVPQKPYRRILDDLRPFIA